jgi:hypothetical protein
VKLNKNLGMILLSIYLIVHGVLSEFSLGSWNYRVGIVMAILAVAAGVVILFDRGAAS